MSDGSLSQDEIDAILKMDDGMLHFVPPRKREIYDVGPQIGWRPGPAGTNSFLIRKNYFLVGLLEDKTKGKRI